MIHKLIPLLLLVVALLFIGCKQENQPTQNESDLELQGLDKKPAKGELITFTGDLSGSQVVEDCCPNAGPSPEYTMILKEDPFPSEISEKELYGNIFMNRFGHNLPWKYIVQFWWAERGDTTFIEVRGGVVQQDRRNKTTTVTFTQDTCWVWDPDGQETIVFVDFTLIRDPQ